MKRTLNRLEHSIAMQWPSHTEEAARETWCSDKAKDSLPKRGRIPLYMLLDWKESIWRTAKMFELFLALRALFGRSKTLCTMMIGSRDKGDPDPSFTEAV
jgi:hypothetical protein